MATPSISQLNKARHKQGIISRKEQEAREKRIEQKKNQKPISPKEHEKRLNKLKNMGILKRDKND